MFWLKSTIIISKSVKIWDFQNWLITWTDELHFRIYRKAILLRINSQFRSENPNYRIWHRNRKLWHRTFFQINVKLSSRIHWTLRIHWRLSTILETSHKSLWSNVFWSVKVCIFWKGIQYTIHWDKIQILKKFPSDKINRIKNALFFLSRAPSHHSFTFNLGFLYELKHKARLSETVCGLSHFRFRFVFIKVFIFAQQNAWTLWL